MAITGRFDTSFEGVLQKVHHYRWAMHIQQVRLSRCSSNDAPPTGRGGRDRPDRLIKTCCRRECSSFRRVEWICVASGERRQGRRSDCRTFSDRSKLVETSRPGWRTTSVREIPARLR